MRCIRAAWRSVAVLSLLALASGAGTGCAHTMWQADFAPGARPESIDSGAPFLKAHLRDGSVLVLTRWRLDPQNRLIRGDGIGYDVNRRRDRTGPLTVRLADVALFETNRPYTIHTAGIALMSVVSTLSLVVTGVVLAQKPEDAPP